MKKRILNEPTIEAVDANGARIETDMIYTDRLGAGQEIYLKAFEYVDQEKLNQFKKIKRKLPFFQLCCNHQDTVSGSLK